MQKWHIVYSICFFGICLLPSVGMLIPGSMETATSENRTLAEAPKLLTEDGVNINVLSDAGDYFQDHFAFRDELVTANALLESSCFGVSAASGVIDGTQGWLYYSDSLSDYQRTDLLSDRGIYNIAHTLSMVQSILNNRSVQMVFAVAPNKNTLYPEFMPSYLQTRTGADSNLTRLKERLADEGVCFVDLESLLQEKKTEVKAELGALYHKKDSHWNNQGAAIAAEAIFDRLGKEHTSYEDAAYEYREDFTGDLDKMLYPDALSQEGEIYYLPGFTYSYPEEIESTFDPQIETVNASKTGNLVMYRDSFGNALLPFMAEEYGFSFFSRGVPYDLSDVDIYLADTVVIERAERFLPDMAENPPVVEAQLVLLPEKTEDQLGQAQEKTEDHPGRAPESGAVLEEPETVGYLQKIAGTVPEDMLETETKIYIRINGMYSYEAFPASVGEGAAAKDNAFVLYLSAGAAMTGDTVEVILRTGEDTPVCIYRETYTAPDMPNMPAQSGVPLIAG